MPGTLYLVATPIGNLKDITFRAVEVLRSADVIACEDTRHSGKLLKALEISGKLVSYHDHNEAERSAEFAKLLADGKSIAVVSDAGTPGINDPGFRLVQTAREIGADVVPIPGAVAFVNAVIASGLPTDSIFFGGFLPSKTGERRKRLEAVKDIPATLVFYETPHRIAAALKDCLDVLGDRQASIGRELTKLHEQIITASLSELISQMEMQAAKGEFVLSISGEAPAGEVRSSLSIADEITRLEAEGVDRKTALKRIAKERGVGKSEIYRLLQNETSDK